MLEERRREHVAVMRHDASVGMAEARPTVGEAGKLPFELGRMPDIVLIAKREQVGVALAGGDGLPQPAREVGMNADARVEPDDVNREVGEARHDCSAVGIVQPVGANENLDVAMRLRHQRFKLTRQKDGVGPIEAENDENPRIPSDSHNPWPRSATAADNFISLPIRERVSLRS